MLDISARDAWENVRHHRLVIAVCVVLGALAGLALGAVGPSYRATAAVLYEPSSSVSGLLVEVLSMPRGDSVETQLTVVTSTPVLEPVATRLVPSSVATLRRRVNVTRVPNTSVIEITAAGPSAREARELANAVAEAYRDYNRATKNARLSEARRFIEREVRDVEARLERSEEQVSAYRATRGVLVPEGETAIVMALLEEVRSDLARTRQRRAELELAQQRLQTDQGTDAPRVAVDPATPTIAWLQRAQIDLLLEGQALAAELPDVHPDRQALGERLRLVRTELRREVGAEVALLQTREQLLRRRADELAREGRALPAVGLGLERLQRQTRANDDLLALLRTRRQETLIREAEATPDVTILQPATEADHPVGPGPVARALLGALVGLTVGAVVAVARGGLDGGTGRPETRAGLPVLSAVPHIEESGRAGARERPVVLVDETRDPRAAEAYRALHARVSAGRTGGGGRVLVVTAPAPGQGATTTAVNLALTAARSGQRALLIDADLRDPTVHRVFGLEPAPGLAEARAGATPWADVVRTVTDMVLGRFEMDDAIALPGLDSLHVVTAGRAHPEAPARVPGHALADVLGHARQAYDLVIVNAPAVSTEDATALAAAVDGVVLVLRDDTRSHRTLRRARARLEEVGASVLGLVVNDVRPARRPRPGRGLVAASLVPPLILSAGLLAWNAADSTRGADERAPERAREPSRPGPRGAEPPRPGASAAEASLASPTVELAAVGEPGIAGVEHDGARSPAAHGARFAVELGPFPTASEAQQVEHRMTSAGYQTARFRQRTGASVYGVFVERAGTLHDGRALAATLAERGFATPRVVNADGTVRIQVGEALALRGAVLLAQRLRAGGHAVRVLVQEGEAEAFVVRHGNFVEREEAESRREELSLAGFGAAVVQVK